MSLDFSILACKDTSLLLERGDPAKAQDHYKDYYTPFVETLVFRMYAVGVGELKKERDCQLLFTRSHMMDAALRKSSDPKGALITTLDYSDLVRCMGVWTNVSPLTTPKFKDKIFRIMAGDADTALTAIIRELT